MILTVREIGADQDGGLSPIPSEHGKSENWLIDSDGYDGGAPLVLPIVGLHEQEVVSGRARSLSKLPGIKGTMYITDSRAAVAVEKFTKGHQYSGIFEVTESVALVASGISAIRAARRRKGKLLVGQVRYQWLKFVGASPRHGLGHDSICLGCEVKDASGTKLYRLYATLQNGAADPLTIAQDIIRRAARYRLSYFPGDPQYGTRLQELTEASRLAAPQPKKMAVYAMPNYFYVSKANAYPQAQQDTVTDREASSSTGSASTVDDDSNEDTDP
jgi:hypothetical protein